MIRVDWGRIGLEVRGVARPGWAARRGEAVPRTEGQSPLAVALGTGDVFEGEDMLRETREAAW